MAEKKSFILFNDWASVVNKLTDESAGRLFKSIFEYTDNGTEPDGLDAGADMAFAFMKLTFDRNALKYDRICEKRREAGRNGGLAKASKSKQMLASASKSKQNVANLADSDNDSDSDNDNVNDSDSVSDSDNAPDSYTLSPGRVQYMVGNLSLAQALEDYIEARRAMKRPVTDAALPLLIEKLNSMTDDVEKQILIVKQSTMNGWQSFVPLDDRKSDADITGGWEDV